MKSCGSDRPFALKFATRTAAALFVAAASLAACSAPTISHGYVFAEDTLSQIPVGSSREQVELVLGSPSTTSTIAGDTYYYISQKVEESPVWGRSIVDQRVLAIYFDEDRKVKSIASYGLKDGKVFDFIQRQTRSGGADLNLISQMLQGVGRTNPFQNSLD